MNKKLLTAAIGAALAAGPMLASTAQADVKLYGKVHVSVDYLDPKGTGDATTGNVTQATSRKQTAVASNASRWGIDISEKLGGSLKAIAKIENEVDMTNDGGAAHTSRNRYVGMNGKFGQFIAGVMDTPYKEVSRTVELFPEYIGDNRNLLSTASNGTLGWDLRSPNALRYDSPSMNGFVANYLYSADGAAGSTVAEDNRRRVDSIGVKYSKGPLYVAYAYETHRLTSNSLTDADKVSEKGSRLGASYNFGAFKLIGIYQNLTDIGGTKANATKVDRTDWSLGGAYTAGNNVFKAQYTKAGTSKGSAGTSADNTGAKMWSIGWDHLFSKTTKAYVAYAKTDNESLAAFTVNGGGHGDTIAPQTGLDPAAWSVGMIVDF